VSYRDDMEAALGRIASLEAMLREQSAPDPDAGVRADLEAARGEIAELQAQLSAYKRALQEYHEDQETIPYAQDDELMLEDGETALQDSNEEQERTELAGKIRLPAAPAQLPSLFDHNRGFAPITTGEPSGVICPLCLAAGERVEMRRQIGASIATGIQDAGAFDFTNVCCPRCMLMSFKRVPLPRRG
jgi:hypothetical protein